MSIETGSQALSQFERRLLAGNAKARIKGLFRPHIVIHDAASEVLGEIRAGLVFDRFPHHARCTALEVEMSLAVAGFLNQSSHLLVNGDPMLRVSHPALSRRYVAEDWQGDTYQLHRRGRPWHRRFNLMRSAGEEELICFECASLCRETVLSIVAQPELKPGVIAGLALLLYYNWYLSLRTAFISAGGAGG